MNKFMKTGVAMTTFMCVVIGFLLVSQAGVTEGQSIYVSAKTITEYQTSIESEKLEVQKILDRIQYTKDQLTRYEMAQIEDDFTEISNELSAEVTTFKMFSGFETVQGSGIKVLIDDGTRPLLPGEDGNNLLVHDIDVLMVVNDLRRCGAEAISVNGQRIVDTTSISCSGYTIRINGQVHARPFVIRAIGDGRRMSASLISSEGYGTYLKDYGIQFSVELVEDMTILGFSGISMYKYMKNMKEE